MEQLFKEGNVKEAWKQIRHLKSKPHTKETIPVNALLKHYSELFGQADVWRMGMRKTPVTAYIVNELDCEIGRMEVVKVFKELKNGKAGGVDGICPEYYKSIASNFEFINNVHKLFKDIFGGGKVPTIWGRGMIHSLYKGSGIQEDPNSYRAITLLPVISKCYAKILTNRIKKWAVKYERISEMQCGFKQGYSTIDNVFVLRSLIDRELGKKRGKLYCCFVDLNKAFDSISREALWYKLKVKGMSATMIRRIQSVYEEASFCVKGGVGKVTKDIKLLAGVRQGCQMSPILFNLFIDDIVESIKKTDTHPPYIRTKPINVLLYADDMVLISLSPIGIQRALNALYDYCQEWKIGVNVRKTKVMTFQNGSKESHKFKWKFADKTLETVKSFKYLGITMNKNGKWTKHQTEMSKKAEIASIVVGKTKINFKDISPNLLNKMFDMLVQPILLYGAEIWGDQCNYQLLDKPGVAHCKRLLGVGNATANVGAVLEAGRVMTSALAVERLISYWLKLMINPNKNLQLECLKMQKEIKRKNCWIDGVELNLKKLGMTYLFEEAHLNKRIIQTVKAKVRDSCYGQMKNEALNKSSLKLMNSFNIDRTGADYVNTLRAGQRSLIARYRLGTWLWQCRKDDNGNRLCELCGETEDGTHAFITCKMLPNFKLLYYNQLAEKLQTFFEILDNAQKARSTNTVQQPAPTPVTPFRGSSSRS